MGDGANALAAAAGMVWVVSEFDDTVTAVDPEANAVDRIVPLGGSAASVTAEGDAVWLAVGASAAEHRGGTLTISSGKPALTSLDPAGRVQRDRVATISIKRTTGSSPSRRSVARTAPRSSPIWLRRLARCLP